MSQHERARLPRGFQCASSLCGLKQSGKDLALFASDVDAAAAAVFTRNHFPGAPVMIGREIIKAGVLRAIIVNSKVSNVGTGEVGLDAARRMAAATASAIGTTAEKVLMSSTGVIGVRLPIEKIEAGIPALHASLQSDPIVGVEGIMTTDSYPKAMSFSIGNATLCIVAKGSGMIAPNMATMLCYIFTDADIAAQDLREILGEIVQDTFNMLSVDTDTSTSDTCVIMANGMAGAVERNEFRAVLHEACTRMTELLARDGEGATKLLRINVRGAANRDDARAVARSVANSPLIKTMAYGADPNVGRLLMAVGKCFDCTIVPSNLNAAINGVTVIRGGMKAEFDEPALRASLSGDPIEISVDIGIAEGAATAYGCDLTEGYVKENAAYYSS